MKNKIIEQKVKDLYKKGHSLGGIGKKLGIGLEYVRAIINFDGGKEELNKIRKIKIDKSVDIKSLKKDMARLKKQGLKKGVDFDVIVKEEGETDEEGMKKLLDNRFIKEDLFEIGNLGRKKFSIKSNKKKILFICSGGLDRSPTAEELVNTEFSDKFQARSVGLYPLTHSNEVTKYSLRWADLIIVMEHQHKADILERFPLFVKDKPEIIVLDVPNEYVRNDPKLRGLLKDKLKEILK